MKKYYWMSKKGKGGHRHKGGKRKDRQREQKPSFHIFCEGVNTKGKIELTNSQNYCLKSTLSTNA